MRVIQHKTDGQGVDPMVEEQTTHLLQAIVDAVIERNMHPVAAISGVTAALIYLSHARKMTAQDLRKLFADYPVEDIMAGYDQDAIDFLTKIPVGGNA